MMLKACVLGAGALNTKFAPAHPPPLRPSAPQKAVPRHRTARVSNSQGGITRHTSSPSPVTPSVVSSSNALVLRASLTPATINPSPEIFLQMSQVVGKNVITRTSGRNLGTVTELMVDVSRLEVVSLALEKKRNALASDPVGFVPLTALRQIGDVVLVHDETALNMMSAPDMQYNVRSLTGTEVFRDQRSIGKVRDFSFSPDTGAVSSLTYDEFGLPLLPLAFFDCFTIPISDVYQVDPYQNKVVLWGNTRGVLASRGLFTVLPSLLRSVTAGSSETRTLRLLPAPGGGYQAAQAQPDDSSASLPPNYTTEQWLNDLREWERRTGMTYEEWQVCCFCFRWRNPHQSRLMFLI
jgi:sporulation protein YlmC with PRC-barrel domain